MSEELMPFDLPKDQSSIIKVLGVGGGGSNAVNHMFRQGIHEVNFIVCNTDAQALEKSPVPVKIQLGSSLTEGRGAGNNPERGKQAAIENLDDVMTSLSDNTKMVFITAGMGGGTGTGAAPVIAKATKDQGILTVAIVTIPFGFEGQRRINQAVEGITELSQHVDSILVINNEKIREIYGNLKISEAFAHADDVLTIAAKGIAEIITVVAPGSVNVDFADVQTVMSNSGVALMGAARVSGEDRALKAVQEALNSPLLSNNDIHGAQNILLNITYGPECEATMDEVVTINEYVQDAAGNMADLIWGQSIDEELNDEISVTVIATGFKTDIIPEIFERKNKNKPRKIHHINDSQKKTETTNRTVENKTKNPDLEVINRKEPQKTVKEETKNEEYFSIKNDDFDKVLLNSINEPNTNENQQQPQQKPLNKEKYIENVDELEEMPAYMRRNYKVEMKRYSEDTNVSKYSISDDGDGTKIRENNSYLHNRVD